MSFLPIGCWLLCNCVVEDVVGAVVLVDWLGVGIKDRGPTQRGGEGSFGGGAQGTGGRDCIGQFLLVYLDLDAASPRAAQTEDDKLSNVSTGYTFGGLASKTVG